MITGARPLSLPLALDQHPLGVDDVENNNSLAIAAGTVRSSPSHAQHGHETSSRGFKKAAEINKALLGAVVDGRDGS
jgi:hypothetical protein